MKLSNQGGSTFTNNNQPLSNNPSSTVAIPVKIFKHGARSQTTRPPVSPTQAVCFKTTNIKIIPHIKSQHLFIVLPMILFNLTCHCTIYDHLQNTPKFSRWQGWTMHSCFIGIVIIALLTPILCTVSTERCDELCRSFIFT